jgi:hypothetical protein
VRVALLAAVAALAAGAAFTVVVHPAPTGGVDVARLVDEAAARALARLPHHGRISIDVLPNRPEPIPLAGVGGQTRPEGEHRAHLGLDARRRAAAPEGLEVVSECRDRA